MSAKKIHNSPPYHLPTLPSLPRTLPNQVPKSLTTTFWPRWNHHTTFLRRNHQCHHCDPLLSSPVSTTTPIFYPKSSTISSNPLQSSLTLNLFRPSEPSNAVALRRTSIFWFWNNLHAYDRNWEIWKIREGCGDTGGVVLDCGLSDCRGCPTLVRVR
ncbi:Blue-light photoreceptor PHR2 [Abeliophyllum distichum]|uniref:Blue-light photoreceptor PHR2 n=1 Tax=Abeliophyllum distichum TaxID=126358 RepID=A0ABD1SZY6_9LAMI